MTTLTIKRFKVSSVINSESIVKLGAITKDELDVLNNAIDNGKNTIIYGGCGAGKTTALEVVIREVLANSKKKKLIYIPVASEINLSDVNILTVETQKASMSSIVGTALAFGVNTLFIEEVRSTDDIVSIEKAIEEGKQVIITMHSSNKEMLVDRIINSFEGDKKRGEKFLSNFSLTVKAKRLPNGTRILRVEDN